MSAYRWEVGGAGVDAWARMNENTIAPLATDHTTVRVCASDSHGTNTVDVPLSVLREFLDRVGFEPVEQRRDKALDDIRSLMRDLRASMPKGHDIGETDFAKSVITAIERLADAIEAEASR